MRDSIPEPIHVLLDAIERTEMALGQELHQGVCQTLAGTSFLAAVLLRNVQSGQNLDVSDLKQVSASLELATKEIRALMQPTVLQPEGLGAAFELLAEVTSRRVSCHFQGRLNLKEIDRDQTRVVYRLAKLAISRLAALAGGGEIFLVAGTAGANSIQLTISRELEAPYEWNWAPDDLVFAEQCARAVGMTISTTPPPLVTFSIRSAPPCPAP